ncbi:MAG: HTH-type transcriptional activator IlvY [Desulfuromonadales bacterium]|nr:HTH-type transcriptional activator IlvY [Desulfuromonadales bacterium]MBN2791197.1 HTH-type transcriptional activator IlvY [Desulfuromonadales bacterium]
MDIRELKIFLTLAELLHFGRASRACHLSSSALTRTIQRLEDELGQPLFDRDNRSVQLTAAGVHFVSYARSAVQEFDKFRTSLSAETKLSGNLSIYASITAVYSLLPDLLEAYRHAHAGVQLELRTGAAETAVAQVEEGVIDIAVAALPDRKSANINFLPIMQTPLVFIAGKKVNLHALCGAAASIDWARVPLVLPQSGLSRRRLDQWLKKKRIVPNISSEVSGNEAIIPMVHLGGGVGVVPRLVLERSPFKEDVNVIADAPQLEPYVVGLCSSRKTLHKPAVHAFWELAKEQTGA